MLLRPRCRKRAVIADGILTLWTLVRVIVYVASDRKIGETKRREELSCSILTDLRRQRLLNELDETEGIRSGKQRSDTI